jgi:N-acetylglucosamine kinase-like BadF-type ATPase
LSLVNDVEIALDAAFKGGRGIVALAGTGSNVACRARCGAILTAGGWGPALADYGSGHYLGVLGLRRCFRAVDQRRPTDLLQTALTHWGLDSLEDLVAYANKVPAPDFSGLAPGFIACAEKGDEVAMEVIRRGGEELAESVDLLIERLRGVEKDTVFRPPPVAVAGSIMTHARLVREAMNQPLLTRFPEIELLDEPADPLLGALWGARQSEFEGAKSE